MVREPDLDGLLEDYELEYGKIVSLKDFQKEINRFAAISKLAKRFIRHGELNARLLMNHIIILNNLFPRQYERILLNNSDESIRPILISFLIYSGRVNEKDYKTSYCSESLEIIKREIG